VRASSLVTLGMAALPLLVAGVAVYGYGRAGRALGENRSARTRAAGRAAAFAAAWLAVTGAVAARGLVADFARRPPPFALLMLATIALAFGLGFSRPGARLAHGLPLAALVGFHSFRLPLELVMHRAAAEGVMPPQMTYTGRNFDIVSGATAVVVAVLLWRGAPRWLAIVWNVVGVALLVAIMVIAMASTPPIHAFGSDAPHLNTWVARFPFVWLPALLVGAALLGHIVLTRALWGTRPVSSPASIGKDEKR
jgi:hypothetical protein